MEEREGEHKEKSEDEPKDKLSYEYLNEQLIINSSPEKVIQDRGYTARRAKEFLYLARDIDPDKEFPLTKKEKDTNEEEKEGDQTIDVACALKFHITLPENNRTLFAEGWDRIKEILIKHNVHVFKVAHAKTQMSEKPTQRGKDITIYGDSNKNFTVNQWIEIMNEVSDELISTQIPPGYAVAQIGPRKSTPIQGSNYWSYRYEKKQPEEDFFANVVLEAPGQSPNMPWKDKLPNEEEKKAGNCCLTS